MAIWAVIVLRALMYLGAAVLTALVYRRTKNAGFLWLLGALFLWPVIESGSVALLRHSARQVLAGQEPALFPYSLMSAGPGWSGRRMPVEDFITKVYALHAVVRNGLLLAAMFFIARGLGILRNAGPSDGSAAATPGEGEGRETE